MGNTDQSKELWADEADEQQRYGKGFHWVESPVVNEYMNIKISGDPNLNWVQYSVDRYVRALRSPRVLSLGCGGGPFGARPVAAQARCLDCGHGFLSRSRRSGQAACRRGPPENR